MEAFETFEHAGFTVELHSDEDPISPADWDQLGTLHTFEAMRREVGLGEPADWQAEAAFERGGTDLLTRYMRLRGEYVVPFRFADYGSSGARIYVGDDRAAGYISTTRARFEELCGPWGYKPDGYAGTPDEGLVHTLTSELGEWDHYVAGEVCGYVLRDGRGEVAESCWGFYPDGEGDGLGYLRAEARSTAEGARDDREATRRATVRGWALAHGQREALPV